MKNPPSGDFFVLANLAGSPLIVKESVMASVRISQYLPAKLSYVIILVNSWNKCFGGTMSRLFESLEGAADGAFAVSEALQIGFWNKAAEEILGFDGSEVTDQYCFQILDGHDEQGRLFCKAHCQVAKSAMAGEPIPNYDLRVRTKQGDHRWLNMSAFTYQAGENGDKKMIIHLFRDISDKEQDKRFLHRLLEVARKYHDIPPENGTKSENLLDGLTQREREVLALMAEGHGTGDIGQQLSISPNTVRNHVQHILQKLQVHTRVEAVTYALKHELGDQ
jgi:PAS domain S-box-containing protein